MLRIQRFLLLALLLLAPALALAQARQLSWSRALPDSWTSRINDAAVGTVNLFDVHRNPDEFGTGLKLAQQTQCANGGGAIYGLRNDDSGSGHVDFFSFRRNDNVINEMSPHQLLTLTNTATQHVTLNFKASQSFSGEATLSIWVSLVAQCNRYSLFRAAFITITLLAQRNIRTAESLAAAGAFRTDRLLASSTAVTTGIVFQRGTMRCPTNMTLLNHTDYLRLQHMNPTGNALTGALATAHSGVAMGGTNARALALLFKAGATVSTGVLTVSVKVDSPASNTNCPAAFAQTITAKLTAVPDNAWEIEGKDSAAASGSFAAPVLAAASSPTPTGIRVHRSSTNCRLFDVALDSAAGNWLGLLRMTVSGGGATTAVGAPGRSFTGVHMQDGNAADNHFRLVFSARANVGARARVERATVEVTPSTTCAASDRPPNPLTLSYAVTIRAGYREVGSNETLQAASVLLINELAASASAVTTGIKFQRGVAACPNTSMSLLNHTGYLRLQPVNAGGALSGSPAVSHANVPMFSPIATNNRALALLFAPRANVQAGTVTARVRVASGTAGSGCTGLLASTITALVTLADPTMWQAGPKARGSAASVLLTTEIGTGLDTGIRFHHYTAACDRARLVLSERTVTGSTGTAQARSIARFQRYTAADAKDGSPGSDLSLASLSSGVHAGLELMGTPPAGTLTLQAVARPACSPAPPGVEPLTLSYVVTLADPLEWQAGPKSRNQAASVLLASEVTLQPDTGIRFHHYTIACDRVRLVLTGNTATIARFQPYTAGGTKGGAPGPDITLVNLLSGVHAGLELMGTPPAGTLTFTAEARPACPSVTGINTLALSYQVTVVDASEAEQAAVGQATGAAVTRVVGLRGIDAVLRRASGNLSAGRPLLELLAAKEQQLESGDLDLRSFLAGQEFALGLDAAASGRPGFGAWGRAEFLQLEDGADSDPLRHEGDMFSAQVGADYRLAGGALFGVGYGRHQLDTDYTGGTSASNAYAGNYVLELDVAQPYASLPLEGGHLAGAVAVGSGEAELKDADADTGGTYDADYLGWALGYREAASDSLEIEGAVSGGSLDIPDLGPDGSKADNMSLRAGARYAPDIAMGAGSLRPSAGVALAVDWGDDPGHKYELSAGLGYASQRLAVAAEYLFIGMNEGDFTASGGSFDVRFSTAPGNLGLGLAATPAHGPAAGADLLAQPDAGMRGAAEIGYGLAVDDGVLTPYGGWSFATAAGEVGLRLRHGDGGSWLLRWRQDERDMIAVEFNLLGD